jgi:hypothetical protein
MHAVRLGIEILALVDAGNAGRKPGYKYGVANAHLSDNQKVLLKSGQLFLESDKDKGGDKD